MTRLDSMLQPNETVVWRRDPELSMGSKWPYAMGLGILLFMLGAIGGVVLWNVAVPPRIAMLAGLLLLFPVLFAGLPLIWGMWSRAVAVTAGRMVWRSGPGGLGTAAAIERAEIAAATIYEGSAVLILHSQDGRTIRLSAIEEAEPLARALAVPTRIWRKGEDAQDDPESFWPRFIAGLLSVIPSDLLGRGLIFGDWSITDEYGGLLLGLALPLILALMAIHVWREVAVARKLSPADRRKQACRRLSPLCRGEEPSRRTFGTILTLPFIAFERWIVRKAHGGPHDCDCPPEVFGPSAAAGGGGST